MRRHGRLYHTLNRGLVTNLGMDDQVTGGAVHDNLNEGRVRPSIPPLGYHGLTVIIKNDCA